MGVYKASVPTTAGLSLIAQALADSKSITFTSIKTSSYAYLQGTNIAELTGLQDIVQSEAPFSSAVFNDTLLQVSVRFSNENVTEKYLIQTVGVYAQLEGGTEETLFAVVQATTPDEMPAQSAVSPSSYIYNVQTTIQQASQLTITVNPAGTATVQDIVGLQQTIGGVQQNVAALQNPTFDDSGTVSGITDFNSFYNSLVSKMSIFDFFRNLKAGLKFVLNVGQLVTDTATNNDNLPAAASAVYKNAQAISKLNAESYEAFSAPTKDGWTFDVWEVRCRKKGCTVQLMLNIKGSMPVIDYEGLNTIITLPEKYRPKDILVANYPSQSTGSPMLISVNTDGTVKLFNNNKAITNEFFCRQTFFYISQS